VSGSLPDLVLPGMEFLTPPQALTAAEPETVPAPSAATMTRFWSKVNQTPTCWWWWTGAISSPDGYGRNHHLRHQRCPSHPVRAPLRPAPRQR
jgi:hypothetical protein